VTGREAFRGEDVEESHIVRHGAIDLAGAPRGDQPLEPGDRLLVTSCLHVCKSLEPLQLVILRKSFERLDQETLDPPPRAEARSNESDVRQAVLADPGARPLSRRGKARLPRLLGEAGLAERRVDPGEVTPAEHLARISSQ